MRHALASLGLAALPWGVAAAADTYTVTIAPEVREEAASGRLIFCFAAPDGRESPLGAPFFDDPHPLASVEVVDLAPGTAFTVTEAAHAFPGPLADLDGRFRLQVILDLDDTERNFAEGPGNLISSVMRVDLGAARDDEVNITLRAVVDGPPAPAEASNLRFIEFRSEMLSEFYGRDVFHRAGIALPLGSLDPDATQTHWPAVYIVPGYGGRHTSAARQAWMLRETTPDIVPQAMHIVLDPESPLGHHGFVDSPNHGPRGTALVREFIPYLETQLQLDARPARRIITGHSSGGWSSLWLQLQWPDVFGACWSSAPDPVDFSAFQNTNLYEDTNLYEKDGTPTPSYRRPGPPSNPDLVRMTVREEGRMEYAISPDGGSGQQWDAWEAMFSPRNTETGRPRPLFDGATGAIDADVVDHWSHFDMARQVDEQWEKYGPIVTQRVHLAVGDRDSFYLNRAATRFREKIEAHLGGSFNQRTDRARAGGGYIWLIRGGTHGNIFNTTYPRWNPEMIEFLKRSAR